MTIYYLLDAESGLPHLWVDHGVSEREVEEVFRHRAEDLPGEPGTRVRIGVTDAGRVLKIIYKRETRDTILVITGYDLRGKGLKAWRRRQRKKRK